MKAIRIESHGGPEVLRLVEGPDPSPGDGEILVRVEAAGLNFIDVYHRTGLYPNPLPLTPGLEGAGVGAGVGFAWRVSLPSSATWEWTPSFRKIDFR